MKKTVSLICKYCKNNITKQNTSAKFVNKIEQNSYYIKFFCLNKIIVDNQRKIRKQERHSFIYNSVLCANCKNKLGHFVISVTCFNKYLLDCVIFTETHIAL